MEQALHLADNPIYRPREPQASPLWSLVHDHYNSFVATYEKTFEQEYGYLRPIVDEVVQAFLKCGDLREGFARVRCPECHHEYLLAFSCKGRWFCPSCHAKKAVQFATRLDSEILFPVPHRQYVFTIPKILRKIFRRDRKLLSELCSCAHQSLTAFLRTATGHNEGVPGAVMAIQTFGDYARWHPHIHAMVADGLFLPGGSFAAMPSSTPIRPLAELFRASVLAMLEKQGRLDPALARKIMTWRHNSGFSVHNGVRIEATDTTARLGLAQYIIRNPFSLEKLRYYPETGMVIYHSAMTHGKARQNFLAVPAVEFIARITQHIPDKGFQMVRYYGWYSNRSRGQRAKEQAASEEGGPQARVGEMLIDIREYRPRRIPSPTWRECIKRVWEVDPLTCPRCGTEMKIISFITEAEVVRHILEHLGKWHERQPLPAAERPPPEEELAEPPPLWDEAFQPAPADELYFMDPIYPD